MKPSGGPTGRIKVRGATPYWGTVSPALPPQESQPGDDPNGQGLGSAPADGGKAPEPLPCPDTALPGSSTPQIEPDAAFEVLGPLSDSAAAPPDPEPQEIDPDEGGLSGQSREQISRALFKASKNRALPRAERPRCNARTRSGGRCQAQGLLNLAGEPGRCRMHGGLSTGAKTAEGLERQRQGASESAKKQRAAARAAGRNTLKNPARDADSPDSKNAAPAAASDAAHMPSAARDRARARHGQPMQVSDIADAPDSAVAAMPSATIDVMSLPCIDDIELPPKRTEVRLLRRNRTRQRQDAPRPDLSVSFAAAAEFRRSGGFEKAQAEMDAFAQEFLRRGGTLRDNAANRKILREIMRDRGPPICRFRRFAAKESFNQR